MFSFCWPVLLFSLRGLFCALISASGGQSPCSLSLLRSRMSLSCMQVTEGLHTSQHKSFLGDSGVHVLSYRAVWSGFEVRKRQITACVHQSRTQKMIRHKSIPVEFILMKEYWRHIGNVQNCCVKYTIIYRAICSILVVDCIGQIMHIVDDVDVILGGLCSDPVSILSGTNFPAVACDRLQIIRTERCDASLNISIWSAFKTSSSCVLGDSLSPSSALASAFFRDVDILLLGDHGCKRWQDSTSDISRDDSALD